MYLGKELIIMLIGQKIEHMICEYEDARKIIGTYVLKQKKQLTKLSMQEIAEETFTSKATLVRFAKKLGYGGWNEFLSAYIDEVDYMERTVSNVNVNKPFEQDDNFLEIASKVTAVVQESGKDTLSLINEDILKEAVHLLASANRICIFAISVNLALAKLFQHKMIMIGKNVEIIDQSEQAILATTLHAGDCGIFISYSGNDEERAPMNLLSTLKERNVSIVALTSMGDNILRSHADVTLTISSRERLYNKVASYASETSIMLLLDILYSCYFALHYQSFYENRTTIAKEVEVKRHGDDFVVEEESQK